MAKLYNVSLDTLLFNEESIEEIVAENSEQNEESKTKEKVVINENGIHVEDEDSVVDITSNGIRLVNEDGDKIEFPRRKKLSVFIESVLIIVAVIGYVLMGFFLNTWKTAWILFLIPEIVASVIRCIEKKKANQLNIAIFCVYIYFLVCNIHPGQSVNVWHPMWVIFLSIPLFYIVVNPFKKHSVEICSEEAKFSNDKDEESDN